MTRAKALLLVALTSLAIAGVYGDDATCSATATASWKSKCISRTAGNRDFLPLTDLQAGDVNLDDTNLADTYRQARLTALKLSGQVGSAAMANMRRKSVTWYELSLKKMLTFFCVETASAQDLERCVVPTSPLAERDVSGACVQLLDNTSCSSQGLCERRSNCKWDDAIDGALSRRELFTAANATAAEKWMEKDYPTSFAPFLAPGVVFAVLTALSCVGFLLLRCVFNQCGGRNPREKGYTKCDIVVPAVIFMVCSAAVFICSFITVAQNTNISEGVTGVLNSLNVTLENIDIFAVNVKTPLEQAAQQLQNAQIAVASQVKDTDWIVAEGNTLRQMLNDFSTIYQNQGPFPFKTCDATSVSCVTCPDKVCGSPLKAFVNNASVSMDNSSGAVARTVQTMQDTFLNKSANISLSLRRATIEIQELANLSESSSAVVDVIRTTFDDYSFSRSALVLSVFLFGIVASLLGMGAIFKGVCKKKTAWVQLLHVSWLLGTLVCILGFVLGTSLLAVGALWYDACNYMNILHTDLTPYFPSRVAGIVNACFNDSSILKPLQLEDALAFQCQIDDNYAMLSKADFNALTAMTTTYGAQVSEYGLRDFGFDSSVSRDLIARANTGVKDANRAPTKSFTQDNIVTPWEAYGETAASGCSNTSLSADQIPVCYMESKCQSGTAPTSAKDKCKEAFNTAYYYVLSFAKISQMLDEMREDLLGDTGKGFSPSWSYDVSIAEFARSYFAKLASVRTSNLAYLMNGEVGKVIENIEHVRCTESCGWINISFNAVHGAMCSDILGTTLGISVCVFFLCFFLIPMIVTGITLQKRLRGAKKGTYEELEKRLQQLETKQRESARGKNSPSKGRGGIDLFKFKKNLDSA
ncbi:hypothetical protein Poli38472_003305 [Pythium oligandrum]|uniref:Uncharacterized protein n=1 Tax=Pythium oligandrum TaxID=41045 RepID=A0A8K1C6T5_PYTOL|nr:hypothetical protein Poli38472_003305 [Pythium oligandrum]|eukprot:TMW57380.1 hypothetical protein Poli38472_003305 [Pythium oligandrum]